MGHVGGLTADIRRLKTVPPAAIHRVVLDSTDGATVHKVDVYLLVRRAVLEWGFRAGVARRLRDKGMPAVEIAEVLEVTRASVYRYLSETEGNES